MSIMTSAIDGFSFEASKVSKSQMPLSFETKEVPKTDTTSFVEVLNGIIEDFETREKLTLDMMSGKNVDVHALMISQAQVDMVSNLASTVTTKVATAYQTLMNMQV
ncbi:MAG: flagellar hook-basal body complex protein FliE [Candidatus Sericytochromatia bacterium]